MAWADRTSPRRLAALAAGAGATAGAFYLTAGPHVLDQARRASRFVSPATPWRPITNLLDATIGWGASRGIVAVVTGQPARDPSAKRNVGIDTSHYRVPGFLLIRTLAGAPNGSLTDAIRVAGTGSQPCPRFPTCDPVVNDIIVRRDHTHLTGTYAGALADDLDRILHARGILPGASG